eukprot:3938432-Rhodomonas_salina.1
MFWAKTREHVTNPPTLGSLSRSFAIIMRCPVLREKRCHEGYAVSGTELARVDVRRRPRQYWLPSVQRRAACHEATLCASVQRSMHNRESLSKEIRCEGSARLHPTSARMTDAGSAHVTQCNSMQYNTTQHLPAATSHCDLQFKRGLRTSCKPMSSLSFSLPFLVPRCMLQR